VTVVEQLAGGSLGNLTGPVLPLTAEEQALFGDGLGIYMQDVTFTPDFPRSAQLARALWRQQAVRAWLWAYPAFLMVGTTMHTGQLRYFLAAFPLLLVLLGCPPPHSLPKIRTGIVIFVCLVGLALQWFWIDYALIMHRENITIWMP